MSEPNRCARCGGPLPQAGLLGGACPRCMMELGTESSASLDDPDITSRPAVVGRYRILRLIGEGGMGAVYEAEQDHPRRIIALKVIKTGIASPELLRRFEQESHALGRLQHPGIAQIYEAGTADTGFGPQPYFAMEFIRGKTLKHYAEEHHLNARQRLVMMSKIAEAVQHAHQRGLIHRDLKPVNIMVDETGQPKILDFGVARTSDSDSQATTQTNMGQLVGTLAYMSPEQVLADPLELDTRSDVYALGVILYELLAGRLPYTVSKKLHETIHAIREEDPARLGSINRDYRGDIETIAAKALEKDKNRRYGSAADLAADIQRFLNDEPIVARPPSAGYQLQKFARRNRAFVAGVVAVFVVLVAGVATSTWQAVRAGRAETAALVEKDRALISEQQARQERDRAISEQQRADTEAATSRAVIEFLGNDLWAMVDPLVQARLTESAPDPNLTVKQALDQAVPRIVGKFEKQPLVEAQLRESIASAYQSLGVLEPAETQLKLAVELRRRHQGENHPETIESLRRLASVYLLRGQVVNGEELLEKVVENSRRTLGDENPTTQQAVSRLVALYKTKGLLEGEAFLESLIKDQRRKLGADHPLVWSNISRLVDLYRVQRVIQPQPKYAEAEALLKEAIGDGRGKVAANARILLEELHVAQNAGFRVEEDEIPPQKAEELLVERLSFQRRTLGDGNLATMATMSGLGDLYMKHGEFGKAEQVFGELWELQGKVLGKNYIDTRRTLGKLAEAYLDDGKYDKGEELLNQLLKLSLSLSGNEEQVNSQDVRDRLAQMFVRQRRYEKAEEQFQAMQTIQRNIPGGVGVPKFRVITAQLAWTRLHLQKYEAAEKDLRTVVPVNTRSNAFIGHNWKSLLGATLVGQKKFADAEPHLLEGYAGLLRVPAPEPEANFGIAHFTLQDAGEWIVRLYQDWGKPEQASEWRTKLQSDTVSIFTPRP